jgi:hypothetical protein
MADDTATPVSLDARATAFLKAVEDAAVTREKIDRAYARKTLNEFYRDRIVAGTRGPVRVYRPGTLVFYETGMDMEDQIAPVLAELVQACPDEFRLGAVKEQQQQVEAMVEEKRTNPRNWSL